MLRMFQPSSTEFWQLETSKLETPEQDSSGTVPARFFARTSAVSAPLRLCVKNSLAGDCPRGFRSFQVFKFSSLQVCKFASYRFDGTVPQESLQPFPLIVGN